MLLIQAEAEMVDGDWMAGMALINSRRDDVGVDNLDGKRTIAAEAWAFLKRERGIELWLEARRLGDLKRWEENDTPGALHPLEQAGNSAQELPLDPERDLCFPISESEVDTNPNI
ncbi:MAG: RagB/SusD family nutrient uptake outer membrane protein [Balneolaceae bacterium]|nr:RagB/SusD family nutrient uptake outer membrane protein [Balneolaceae bacterium]